MWSSDNVEWKLNVGIFDDDDVTGREREFDPSFLESFSQAFLVASDLRSAHSSKILSLWRPTSSESTVRDEGFADRSALNRASLSAAVSLPQNLGSATLEGIVGFRVDIVVRLSSHYLAPW